LSNVLTAQSWTVLVHSVNNESAGLGVAAKDDAYPNKRLHLLRRRSGAVVAAVLAFWKIGKYATLFLGMRERRRCGVSLGCDLGRSVWAKVAQLTSWNAAGHLISDGTDG
jgi:hypothetical protein